MRKFNLQINSISLNSQCKGLNFPIRILIWVSHWIFLRLRSMQLHQISEHLSPLSYQKFSSSISLTEMQNPVILLGVII